jgi:hypothetical protein
MSVLLIDFKYLYGRDGDPVVKELTVADPRVDRVSSYKWKCPYALKELPKFIRRLNTAVDHRCKWNDGDIPYTDLKRVLQIETSSATATYCIGSYKAHFIRSITNCQVTDVSQVECSTLIRMLCTFTFHNGFNHFCHIALVSV